MATSEVQDDRDPVLQAAQATDVLVRRALAFLSELFPAAHTHVGYVHKEDAPLLGGGLPPSSEAGVPPGRFEDIREVPGHPEVLRAVTVNVDERISEFLDGQDGNGRLEEASALLKIPVILAHEWTRKAAGPDSVEVREALRAQLSVHIIAHLIANQFAQATDQERYRFARHGEPRNAHDRLARTLVESIDYVDTLTRSRVENQELSHGLVIAPLAEGEAETLPGDVPFGRYPEDFRSLKRTSFLTDGDQTALRITPGGQAVEIITSGSLHEATSDLERDFGSLGFLVAATKKHEGIGIVLRPGGAVLAFADGEPLFIRRSGSWRGLLWDQIRHAMKSRYGDVGTRIFGAVLILTTSSKGGILSIFDDGPEALNLHVKDRVDRARATQTETPPPEASADPDEEADHAEWLLHQLLPAGSILDLSRSTLALLAGIDGATIVSPDGTLLSYGAIVQSMQGRSEGARTAAARTLSRHGLVIKVSEDGPVEIFEDGESVLTV